MSDLQSRMARGAVWMIVARVCDRGLGFVSITILARLLGPDAFGLIAMAMSVVALLDLLRAFGLDVVLIHHQAPERKHYDTAWTINILASVGVGVVLAALAEPASIYYREPRLTSVMLLLALAPALNSLRNIGVVDFRKNLDFDKEFRFMFSARLVRFAITVPLAFALRNQWALVGGMLMGAVAEVVISYLVHPYRPRFSLAAARELYNFSRWLLIKNLIQIVTQRAGDFVIGRLADARALGLFHLSKELAYLPSGELAAPINRVLMPGFAKQAANPEGLRKTFLDAVSILMVIVLPAGVGLMLTAKWAVPIVLGTQWLDAIPLVQVISVYAIGNALGSNTGALFLAIGKPKIITWLATTQLVIVLPGLLYGVNQAGAIGAAWAYVASFAVVVPLSYGIAMSQVGVGVLTLAGRVWRPVLGVAVMAVAVRSLADQLPPVQGWPLLWQFGMVAGAGAVVYGGVVLALWLVSGRPAGAENWLITRVVVRLPNSNSDPRG